MEGTREDGGPSRFARAVAIGAVLAAIVLVAILMFSGGSSYTVSATFQNAGQLVKGNQVEVGGRPIGTVQDIELTANGQAKIKMELEQFTPLHAGTTAVVRAASLSGIANRYVSINPGPDSGDEIPNGGEIKVDSTTAPVDLDQLFDTLDPETRKGLQNFIRGSADQFDGKSKQANDAAHYFNPALSTSSKLLQEVVLNQDTFRAFVTNTSEVVAGLAERAPQLTDLVSNTNTTAAAIGDENVALARALGLLPGTLRKANTTFVNLRSTLDDLDVLVDASKPATKDLTPFLRKLRPLVADAKPTIRSLRLTINRKGKGNDLIDLVKKTPKLASITDTAFPRTVQALQRAQPVLEFIRPYSPDLVGWFTKFGQGAANYDANGHFARIQPLFNTYSINANPLGQTLNELSPAQRSLLPTAVRQNGRCPGSATQPAPDGSNPYLDTPNFECDKTSQLPGP